MSQKQVMMKVLEDMPEDVSFEDIIEALKLVSELRNRIDNFDENDAITSEQLKEEMKTW